MTTAFSLKQFDASKYAQSRPRYPDELLALVYAWQQRSNPTGLHDALDIGTGVGQLAYRLTSRFQNVFGIDPSQVMLEQARVCDAESEHGAEPLPQGHAITFAEGTAEATGMGDQSVDVVVAGTAAHWFRWFDEPQGAAVWRELARVVRPKGTVAFIGYNLPKIGSMAVLNKGVSALLLDGQDARLEKYLDPSPTSSLAIAISSYSLIPRPTSPMWDESATQLYKIDPYDGEQVVVPDWIYQALGQGSGTGREGVPCNVMRRRAPLRSLINNLRSASRYIHYLKDHPEQAEKVKEDKDSMVEWLDELRIQQARQDAADALGARVDQVTEEQVHEHIVPWDAEVEFVYPLSIFLARRSDQVAAQ